MKGYMAEDQPIYLSPEDNLTIVRERLEKTANRRIVLIVPAETQLRSNVSWRLLYTAAGELGKDILIVSPDRQIRSVAKDAGFRTADLHGSTTTAKSRGGSSPSRVGLGGKTAPRLRTPPTKGKVAGQNVPPVKGNAGAQSTQGTPPVRGNAGAQSKSTQGTPPVKGNADVQSTSPAMGKMPTQGTPPVMGSKPRQSTPPVMGSMPVQGDNAPAGTGVPPNDQIAQQYDNRFWSKQEDTSTEWALPPLSPTYDPDDYSLGPSSSNHPLGSSSYEDEEPDFLHEDYLHAQSILEAAQPIEEDTVVPTTGTTAPPQETPKITDLSSKSGEVDDPLSNMVDDHPSSLPEQRGGVIFHHPDDVVDDISDESTSVLHIEDLGDVNEEFYHLPGSTTLDWDGETLDEEQDVPGPSRVHGVHRRTSRTGGMQPSQAQRSGLNAEDPKQPPVYDQRTRLSPIDEAANEQASYPVMGTGHRTSPVTRTPPVSGTRSRPANQRPYVSPVAQAPLTASKATTPQPKGKIPKKKSSGNVGLAVAGLVSILVLLLVGLLAYLGPTADVTVTLQSHEYSQPLKLTATGTSQLNVSNHTIPAQTLSHNTSASGPGHATGTTTVGTVQATGTVVFTNNSNGSVVVPNGTIVATKNNVQFVTQAEVLVLSGSSNNTNLAPIQAQIAGTNGNVPAGSITVIPSDNNNLNRIQQANPSVTNLNLTVINPSVTTGGGAGSAATVTNQDVTTLKQQLDLQLQSEVNGYIKKNTHAGDQLGNIVRAESPPVVTPSVGSVVTSGTFLMTINLHFSVLVVKAATIQAASIAEMNAALSKQNTGMALVPQQLPKITKMTNKPSSDGKSLTLSYTAIGQVAPQVPEDTVRQLVSGKSADDAKAALTTGNGAIPNAVNAEVKISPGFVGWVTFYLPHITVHYKAVPKPPSQPPKKK